MIGTTGLTGGSASGRVVDRVAARAREQAQAVAISERGREWRYGELEVAANRVGHYLRGLGIGPESRVGVCMRRRGEAVAALLGVWKAGAAYVPLDPRYPVARLEWMREDAGVE